MALRVQIPPHPPGYASRCGSGCIDGYTGERSASGSTMGCSRPLIFPANAGKAPPSKEEEGESPVHSSLPPPLILNGESEGFFLFVIK